MTVILISSFWRCLLLRPLATFLKGTRHAKLEKLAAVKFSSSQVGEMIGVASRWYENPGGKRDESSVCD